MIPSDYRPICFPVVHESQVLLHVSVRKERDVFQTQRLKNVVVAIIVQGKPGNTFQCEAREVDVHAILPSFGGLEAQRLDEIFDVSRELIKADGMREVA